MNFGLSLFAVLFAGYSSFAAQDQANIARAQYAAALQATTTKLLVEGGGVRAYDAETKWTPNFESGTLTTFEDPDSRVFAVMTVTNIGQSIAIIDRIGIGTRGGSGFEVQNTSYCSDPAAPKTGPMAICVFPRAIDSGATQAFYVYLTPEYIDKFGCGAGDFPITVWVYTVDDALQATETDFLPGPSGVPCAQLASNAPTAP